MLPFEDGTAVFESPRQVHLTQCFNRTSFCVTVSRFEPGPHYPTTYTWIEADGVKRKYAMPPYYISDMAEASRNMRHFARTANSETTRVFLADSNPIVKKTFKEAERYCTASKATQSNLVAAAIMLWSTTKMVWKRWLVCGTDTLGMRTMEHDMPIYLRNPFMDSALVTPVMQVQLETMLVRDVLVPLKDKLLRLLKEKILAKKKEDWYEIYLVSFIILHNTEWEVGRIAYFTRRLGLNPAPQSNRESSLSQAYYHACKTVLAYFHFASGGAAPLSLDWVSSGQNNFAMTEPQIAYLRDIKDELVYQDTQLRHLKNVPMYADMYWCHQMLFPGWKADMPHLGAFLEVTEKDYLAPLVQSAVILTP
ncbi:hypothetical protein C8A00DRAFT_17199 [Chaetomidium leptoderma]|uniref:Uncharacterized protein n=1 Tax=Chaetomidium leptoderma TaxID=669021 RepID=A0AAN6VHH1_9PEZI|nr:hypothetical protein C8A00DRAFT_17199 [Chaetomidium leptoderma]